MSRHGNGRGGYRDRDRDGYQDQFNSNVENPHHSNGAQREEERQRREL